MTWQEPGYPVADAVSFEELEKPWYAHVSAEDAGRVVGKGIFGIVTRAEVAADGVEVDREADMEAAARASGSGRSI